jgi:uncharacterized SAM-binding protein YcdF (DUF218 family)
LPVVSQPRPSPPVFFVLSKVVWFLMAPSSLMMLAVLYGLARGYLGNWRSGRRWLVGGVLALLIGGIAPLADLLFLPLESRFHRPDLDSGTFAGIIVLGGGEETLDSNDRELMPLSGSAERLTEAVALARRLPNARLVFTGGSDELFRREEPEARAAGRLFVALGIEPGRLTLEERSRNTAENAAFTKALVEPKAGERWLLVTSAWHMPRAMGCFRKAGFAVEAWPVDYRGGTRFDPLEFTANLPEGLHRLDFAAKEYFGLLAYRLTGRIDDLLPGPSAP